MLEALAGVGVCFLVMVASAALLALGALVYAVIKGRHRD